MFDWLKNENEKEEITKLPTFPDFPSHKGFAQSAIKEAVEDNRMPPAPKLQISKKMPEIPSPPLYHQNIQMSSHEENDFHEHAHKDVFIKIDRFHAAKKAIQTAKERLEEVEMNLRKLRETTTREEIELNSWEKELEILKSKIREVSENIFEKVE